MQFHGFQLLPWAVVADKAQLQSYVFTVVDTTLILAVYAAERH